MSSESNRFKKIDLLAARGTKIKRILSDSSNEELARAKFLARLWTLFGEPSSTGGQGLNYYDGEEAFHYGYAIQDSETSLIFTAYCARNDIVFGAMEKDNNKIEEVLDIFENELRRARLANCQIVYDTDFGPYRAGALNGIPFEDKVNDPAML